VNPLLREGLSASWVGTPPAGELAGQSLLQFLCARFPSVNEQEWRARWARGDLLDAAGHALPLDAPCPAASRVYYFRSQPSERRIPFDARVLFEDELIVIADKPHFLPVVPSGRYVRETLLVRLKHALKLPELSPAHRIDRDTAGLVLLTKAAKHRGAYQALFRTHQIHKTYEAVAPFHPALTFPLERASRLVRNEAFMQATEAPGAPNARTCIDLLEVHGNKARYLLVPTTGQRHQLRVHMNALGMPIDGDCIYPHWQPEVEDTDAAWALRYQTPLKLLAKALRFQDPVSGVARCFVSERHISL
jgi:tRNA pseudouridine32 synthase / 23S rRNA pseudouridine746 synthase